MQRTKKSKSGSSLNYPISEEPIILSKILLDLLLKQISPSELISLYTFYYYTAKWQKTNQPKATVDYVSRGLNWSSAKVRKYRRQLLELNLIEDVRKKDNFGLISGHFVKVNFISSTNHPHGNPDCGLNYPVDTKKGNALISNNKIIIADFNVFWRLFPKKIGKGGALTSWTKLCKKKEAPSIKEIKKAVQEQKESEQWQNSKYIPHATTWLNQSRWLDDASQMKSSYRSNESQPEKKIEYGEWWFKNKDDGKYYNNDGQIFM